MINYFKVDLVDVDENNIWHNVYIIMNTPNPASQSMQSLLGGYLGVKSSEVKNISEREFELYLQEERIINEIQRQ